MKHATALAAQVAAWNRVNAEANRLAVELARIFAPFVGKKVTCNGGSLTQRVKAALPEFSCVPELHIWHPCSEYHIDYAVKVSELEDKGDYCGSHYAETYVQVGKLKDHVLESLNEPYTDRRTDYTEAEIIAKRQALEKAEKAFHDAQSDLSPFKRFDW